MSKYLLPLFIAVPIIELQLLIIVHDYIGLSYTLLLVFITGVFGVNLAKREGFGVLRKIQDKMSTGQMPTTELADGVFILVGGVLLVTPGVLTDIFGFTCLIPFIRSLYKKKLLSVLKNNVTVYSSSNGSRTSRDPNRVDVDWNELDK